MSATTYDLTPKLIPYLDRHLCFPLLAFLSESKLYPDEREILKAQYELAKETNMVDYYTGLWSTLNEDTSPPDDFVKKREEAMATNERLAGEAQAVLDVIQNPEVVQALRQDKMQNLNYLSENYKVTLTQITTLYNFGQFQYTYGNYTGAADYLYHFRILSTQSDLLLSAQWGKVASDILSGQWDTALEELNRLKDLIENGALPTGAGGSTGGAAPPGALTQLQSRAWLMHWSLFVYFNHQDGRTALLETFLSPAYLNTMQIVCPWLLRYLAAAAILSRSSSNKKTGKSSAASSLAAIVKLIQAESYSYADPVTDFLKDVYVDFNFEQAQNSLKEAEKVLERDFFLEGFKDEFLENARFVVSEAYCRIHQRIDIADLSARLNLTPAEGEKWIVNLIRDSSSILGGDAKIDLEQNVISTSKPSTPIYQTVIERTKGLAFRSQVLGAAMGKRVAALATPATGEEQSQPSESQIPQPQKGGRRGKGGGGGGSHALVAAEA